MRTSDDDDDDDYVYHQWFQNKCKTFISKYFEDRKSISIHSSVPTSFDECQPKQLKLFYASQMKHRPYSLSSSIATQFDICGFLFFGCSKEVIYWFDSFFQCVFVFESTCGEFFGNVCLCNSMILDIFIRNWVIVSNGVIQRVSVQFTILDRLLSSGNRTNWINSNKFEQIRTNPDKLKQIRTNSDKLGQIRTNPIKIRPTSIKFGGNCSNCLKSVQICPKHIQFRFELHNS